MPGKVAGRVGSTGSARPTPRNMRRDKERCERENRAAQERREKAASEAKRRRDERMTQEQINHDTYVHRAARAEATAEISGFPRGGDPRGIGEKLYEREIERQGGIDLTAEQDLYKWRKEVDESKEFLLRNPSSLQKPTQSELLDMIV